MSRIDVDAIARDVARERAEQRRAAAEVARDRDSARADRMRELERVIDRPFSRPLEGRLLAAMLSEPGVLEICDGVELDDFADYGHRWVLTALRNVQARGEWTDHDFGACIDAIGDELARLDKRDEKHMRDTVDDLYLAELLGRHMWETYGPIGAPIRAWVEHDAAKLRELADRRRAL